MTNLRSRMKMRSLAIFLSVTLILSTLASSLPFSASAVSAEQIYTGLYYNHETVKNSSGSDVNTFVLQLDTSGPLTIATGVPDDETPLKAGRVQTVSGQARAAMAHGTNVVAAINCDFFAMGDNTAIQPNSITIKDGVQLQSYNTTDWQFFAVLKDGTPIIGDYTKYNQIKDNIKEACGADYGYLVKDGVAITGNAQTGKHSMDVLNPRTAIGIKEDGKTVVMVVADGRNSGGSAGYFGNDLAAYMKSLGCYVAVNLDGGGSSTMVTKDSASGALVTKNKPSDGVDRAVGNCLMVVDPREVDDGLDKTTVVGQNAQWSYYDGTTNPSSVTVDAKFTGEGSDTRVVNNAWTYPSNTTTMVAWTTSGLNFRQGNSDGTPNASGTVLAVVPQDYKTVLQDAKMGPSYYFGKYTYNGMTAWSAGIYLRVFDVIGANVANWKKASGPFGVSDSGYDDVKTVVAQNKTDENHPTYLYQTTFNLKNANVVRKLTGSLTYKDAAVVYINGQKVAQFNTTNYSGDFQYGAASALSQPTDGTFKLLDNSMLKDGENTLSVEIHQKDVNSADTYFSFNSLDIGTLPFSLQQDTDGYYLVKKASDFGLINLYPNANYRLANDINLNGSVPPAVSNLSGDFDGNGKIISNLYSNNGAYGLFTEVGSTGRVHDLRIIDADITGTAAQTGSVASICSGTIERVTVTGRITGTTQVGGIAGYLNGGTIRQCSVGAYITGTSSDTRVGGIIGDAANTVTAIVEANYVNAVVQGIQRAGGVVGFIDTANDNRHIRNNIVEGTVKSVSASGNEPGGIGGLLKTNADHNIVRNMTITSESTLAPSSGGVAAFIGAWSNLGMHEYNVVQSGSITVQSSGVANRIQYQAGTTIMNQNYAYEGILINGAVVTANIGHNQVNGANATAEDLTTKSFYEGLGFDFNNVFGWDDGAKNLYLRGVDMTVRPVAKSQTSGIIVNVGADESQRNVTWYSDSVHDGVVQLALKSDMTGVDFPKTCTEYPAVKAASSFSGLSTNKAMITNLQPNTQYIYRVGNADGWSYTSEFKTNAAGNFSFLFAGDPQIGSSGNVGNDTAGWTNTLIKATQWFPDASLLVSAGDQVETYNDENQYAGYLAPNALRSLTVATNIGNHDSAGVNYKQHFSVPNGVASASDTKAGGDYWYSYNGALFMSLNSNNTSTAQHKTFLTNAIQAYKNQNGGKEPTWKIVTFHHSVYSTASHTTDSDILQRRNELPVVFRDLGIDAVLQGHDHVYTRSYMMNGTTPITSDYTANGTNQYASYKDNPSVNETVYITANSASGSKFYAIQNLSFPFKAIDNQENTPNITKIDVSSGALVFTTYRTGTNNTVNDVVDTFTLNRGVTPSITTASVSDGFTSTAYSQTIAATGDAPITYSIDNGTLPTGLSLDSASGAITGTPTAKGTFTFTVKATNIYGSDFKTYTVKVEILGNKTYLDSEIAKTTGLNAALYTESSWSALQTALAQAQAVNSLPLVSQTAVDNAFFALSDAIDSLVYAANKTALKAAIDIASTIKLANYSQATADAVAAALNSAVAVNSNAAATQAQVDAAYNTLMDAVLDLVLNQPDPDVLKAISAGQVLDQTQYTAATWAVLDAALHNALLVVADPASTQAQNDAAKSGIINAISGLVVKNDTKALKAAVDKASALDLSSFKAEQIAAFQTALAKATAVLNNDQSTKAEIEAATTELTNAMGYLRIKADKADIDALVAQINAIDQAKYTQASVDLIKTLLAKVTGAGYNMSTQELADFQNELATLKTQLVLLSTTGTGTGSTGTGNNPKTGDNSAELWIALTALCSGVVIFVRRRKAAKR